MFKSSKNFKKSQQIWKLICDVVIWIVTIPQYKSKLTVRWDRQSQGIENRNNKATKNIAPPLDTGPN